MLRRDRAAVGRLAYLPLRGSGWLGGCWTLMRGLALAISLGRC